MQEQDVYDRFIPLLKPYSKNQDAYALVNQDSKILADLQVNSARLVDIILAVEDEFDIEVDDEGADTIYTVGDAVKMIHNKIQ
jgi:acyl carrier protein